MMFLFRNQIFTFALAILTVRASSSMYNVSKADDAVWGRHGGGTIWAYCTSSGKTTSSAAYWEPKDNFNRHPENSLKYKHYIKNFATLKSARLNVKLGIAIKLIKDKKIKQTDLSKLRIDIHKREPCNDINDFNEYLTTKIFLCDNEIKEPCVWVVHIERRKGGNPRKCRDLLFENWRGRFDENEIKQLRNLMKEVKHSRIHARIAPCIEEKLRNVKRNEWELKRAEWELKRRIQLQREAAEKKRKELERKAAEEKYRNETELQKIKRTNELPDYDDIVDIEEHSPIMRQATLNNTRQRSCSDVSGFAPMMKKPVLTINQRAHTKEKTKPKTRTRTRANSIYRYDHKKRAPLSQQRLRRLLDEINRLE